MSQLLSQNSLFQTAIQELAKEIKILKRENIQIRSKHDILQVRVKSLQGSQDHDSSPKILSARKSLYKADDQFDFQFTSRLDNIVNQSTRNRLESLRKDLEGVLRGEEEKVEPAKEENNMTIMEEWSNPSELNLSQTQSDRSQFTTVMLAGGDNTFQAAPSLMEQLDMLSVQQGSPKSPFEIESTADNSSFSRAVTFSFGGAKKGQIGGGSSFPETNNILNDGHQQQARQTHGRSQVKNKSLESHGNHGLSPTQISQKSHAKVVPQLKLASAGVGGHQQQFNKGGNSNGSTMVTFAGAGETIPSLQKYSSEPSYFMDSTMMTMTRSEEVTPKQNTKGKQPEGPAHFGTMDIKTKKELYLRGDNMLMGVLDRLEETVQKGGSPLLPSHNPEKGAQVQVQGSPETFRLQVNNAQGTTDQSYYFSAKAKEAADNEQERIKRINSSDNNPAFASPAINSGRGTKKLKLGRLSMKGKDGLTSLHESLSSNTDF